MEANINVTESERDALTILLARGTDGRFTKNDVDELVAHFGKTKSIYMMYMQALAGRFALRFANNDVQFVPQTVLQSHETQDMLADILYRREETGELVGF